MRYGIIVNAGDPRVMAGLAAEAESAGWDGVFYYDAIAIGDAEMYDPWVVLAAMALRTERVRLGLILTPPSRRRPWKLARETMTLDRLSGGRLILPVGLGALDDAGFGHVGEATDARTRAELLDESLAILDGLWSGEPFAFEGRHYRFTAMTFRPTPVQRPRIPIWVVGILSSERSMRRALRWAGRRSGRRPSDRSAVRRRRGQLVDRWQLGRPDGRCAASSHPGGTTRTARLTAAAVRRAFPLARRGLTVVRHGSPYRRVQRGWLIGPHHDGRAGSLELIADGVEPLGQDDDRWH